MEKMEKLIKIFFLLFILSSCSFSPEQSIPTEPDRSMRLSGFSSGNINDTLLAVELSDMNGNGCGYDAQGNFIGISSFSGADGGLMPAFRIIDYSFTTGVPATYYLLIMDSNERHVNYDNQGCGPDSNAACVHMILANIPAEYFNSVDDDRPIDINTIADTAICDIPTGGGLSTCSFGPSYSFVDSNPTYRSGLGSPQYDGPCPDGYSFNRYRGLGAEIDFNLAHGDLTQEQIETKDSLTEGSVQFATVFYGEVLDCIMAPNDCYIYTVEAFALDGNVGSINSLLTQEGLPIDRETFREQNSRLILNNPDGTPTNAVASFFYQHYRKDRDFIEDQCYNYNYNPPTLPNCNL